MLPYTHFIWLNASKLFSWLTPGFSETENWQRAFRATKDPLLKKLQKARKRLDITQSTQSTRTLTFKPALDETQSTDPGVSRTNKLNLDSLSKSQRAKLLLNMIQITVSARDIFPEDWDDD